MARTRVRRNFTPEFKAEAVKMVVEGGRSMSGVAEEIGVYPSVVRAWVVQARADGSDGTNGQLTTAEHEELVALRRENKRLRMEASILKKATAFFARTSR